MYINGQSSRSYNYRSSRIPVKSKKKTPQPHKTRRQLWAALGQLEIASTSAGTQRVFHCERSNFVVIGRCRFCTCVPGYCVRRSLCFLPFAPPSCPTFEILSSPEAGNILHRIALEWRQQVDRPGLLCSCSRWPRSWHGLWHFPLHFDDPGCKILNFLNGAVLMTHGDGLASARFSMQSANR